MKTWKTFANSPVVCLSSARRLRNLFSWLVLLLVSGCVTLQPPDQIKKSVQSGPAPMEKSIQAIEQKVAQTEQSSRAALAELQGRLAAQESELRLLQGNMEVIQHENQRMKERLAMEEEAALEAQHTRDQQAVPAQTSATQAQLETGVLLSQAVEDDTTPQQSYDAAFLLLKEGKYEASRRGFGRFLERFPQDALADNAQYWIGELYSVQKKYREALAAFNQVLVRWPTSTKVPASLLKIGIAFSALGDLKNAHTSLTRLVDDYPHSPAVSMAKKHLLDIARKQQAPQKQGVAIKPDARLDLGNRRAASQNVMQGSEPDHRTSRINRVMGN